MLFVGLDMTTPPALFDTRALELHRSRSLRGTGDVWFLHDTAAAQVSERLNEVNRSFKRVTIVAWNPMLWERRFPDARIVAPTDILDIEEQSNDLIIHAMGLHWCNDPVGQLVQMRRGLKPDGMMIAVFFGGQTLSELRVAMAKAEACIDGGISPRVAPMGDLRDLGGLLQRAGFALPVADSDVLDVSYVTPLHLMKELRAMGESNAMVERRKGTLGRAILAAVSDVYINNFPAEGGRVTATFEMIYLTGWAPSENQQKPLRPGSAQSRLAKALNTKEIKT